MEDSKTTTEANNQKQLVTNLPTNLPVNHEIHSINN